MFSASAIFESSEVLNSLSPFIALENLSGFVPIFFASSFSGICWRTASAFISSAIFILFLSVLFRTAD